MSSVGTTARAPAPAAAGLRGPAEWDWALLAVAALLAAVGLVAVYSASITVAAREVGNSEYYLQRQA
ncbi:MAG TPA: hypothetical protein VHN38_03595, partial [Immundisolibacter sp.]|nr:hypothetical protein [Immundisolibacter sp.]